jgi:ATP-binding cassette subfamily C protein
MKITTALKSTWQRLPHVDRRDLLILTVLITFGAVLEALGLGMIVPLVSLMVDADPTVEKKGLARIADLTRELFGDRAITVATLAVLAIFFFKNVYLVVVGGLRVAFNARGQVRLGREMFRAKLSAPWVEQRTWGLPLVMRQIMDNPSAIYKGMLRDFLSLVTEIFFLVSMVVVLMTVDFFTTFMVLVLAGTSAGLYYRLFQPLVIRRSHERFVAQKERRQALINGWVSPRETRLYGAQEEFIRGYEEADSVFHRAHWYLVMTKSNPPYVLEVFGVMTLCAVLVFADMRSMMLPSYVPILSLVAVAAMKAIPAVNRLLKAFLSLRSLVVDIQEVLETLPDAEDGTTPSPSDSDGPSPSVQEVLPLNNELTLNRVTFSYPDAKAPVLEDFSASIPAHSMVGLVGPSGSGKSTLADLILGLLKPESGEIRVDGRAIHEHPQSWQRHLAYVPQEVAIIPGTLKENVAYGPLPPEEDDTEGSDLLEKRVRDALEAAQLTPWLARQEAGLNTRVGTGGVLISGGEKQRLGIARALFRKPSLLVLDEPTSALDERTEDAFLRMLQELKSTCTVLVITHRKSTREACDVLIHLDHTPLPSSTAVTDEPTKSVTRSKEPPGR